MNKAMSIFVVLIAVTILGCTGHETGSWQYRDDLSTQPTGVEEPVASAFVFLGSVGGNGILTTNSSRFDGFRFFRKIDGNFTLINPTKDNVRSDRNVHVWIDKGFSSFADYRVVAIDKDGNKIELPTIVAAPKQQNK